MNGEAFLEEILQKLKIRIEELDQALAEGQKEIEEMHEYYWENYTEMDQYGYEDYDNQQALLHEVNASREKRLLKHRFKKMLDSPFFGKVEFRYDGEEEADSFYIGIGNFAECAGKIPLIYDWRAPVSGLFYDYDKGPASYEAPAGVLDGVITSKWQYKIRGGKIIYAFESDTKIDDEILKAELGTNGDVQLKNIVRTIQKEQNAIIRNTKDRILVIQGAAGSGKTSVALHRIAYLLYHDREHLKSSNILILSPNSVFSDYISHILPELGEENIREMSFDLFAYRELNKIVTDCEDRYDHLEQIMSKPDPEALERFHKKQSAEFIGQMEGFLAVLEDRLLDFREIEFKGLKLTEEELIRFCYFKFQEIPLLSRVDSIMEYFIDEYETLKNKELSDEEKEFLRGRFDQLYVTKDLYVIYNWLLEECGYPTLPDIPYEKRKLPYEDVFPMLYLKYRLSGSRAHRHIKHLVIDEMQDYSYLQYVILHELFSCKMTILGDRAQTLDEKIQDVLSFLPRIFGKNVRKLVMNKSYRNTIEIAQYAARLNGISGLELLERHGKAVVEKTFCTAEELLTEICGCLRVGEMEYETAAVITMMEKDARNIYKELKEDARLQKQGVEVSYIDRNSSVFCKGLTVTTFYLAKGLEFDQVFCIRKNDGNPLCHQSDYICATRALHELYMYTI